MSFAEESLLGRKIFVPCFVWACLALSLPSTFQTRLIMLFAFFACLFSLIHLSSILNHVLWYFLHRKSSFQTILHFWVIPAKSYFLSTLNSFADICRPHKITLTFIMLLVVKEGKRWAYIHIVHKSMYLTDLLCITLLAGDIRLLGWWNDDQRTSAGVNYASRASDRRQAKSRRGCFGWGTFASSRFTK